MTGLDELRLRLGIPSPDRSKDALLSLLIGNAVAWAKDFCRMDDGEAEAITDIIVAMAAHDYAILGAEGVGTRSLSGITESYRPDYPEHIMARLRAHRRMGVPS